MTAREELADMLKPQLPAAWKLVPYSTNLDVIDRPTVMINGTRIERSAVAPLAGYLFTFVVTVIDPAQDPERAEGALDDEVTTLLAALDEGRTLLWTSAEKVLFGESNLAWDITLSIIVKKEEA